jgi:type I restriction enzyme S subunit
LVAVLAAATALERSYTDSAIHSDLSFELTVEAAIADGLLEPPQDGNHGEKHPKASDYCERGIPFLMAADLANDELDLAHCKFISKELADSLRIGFAKAGDVLLTHKGTIGLFAIVPPLSTEYVMLTPQVTYYRVLPDGPLMHEYLAVIFRSSWFQSQMHAACTGSTRAYLGITAQRRLAILCPPPDRQREVVRMANALTSTRRRIEQRLSQLGDVAKALVSRLGEARKSSL